MVPKFGENGLIPVITQDYETNEVLMLAYMNEEAFNKTKETGKVHYYSRSRKELWLKGETSGHYQNVIKIFYDCDMDTLLIKVEQIGGACHTGHRSCFYRTIDGEVKDDTVFDEQKVYKKDVLNELIDVVNDRKNNPKEGSYTNYLFDKGIDKILKKVGEETAEVIIAAKNTDDSELTYEIADLMYHLTVLLSVKEQDWNNIYKELKKRR